MEPFDTLNTLFLFRGITAEEADRETPFLSFCQMHVFPAGELIQKADNPLDALAVLCGGRAEVLSDASDDGIVLRTLQKGDLIGAATLYGGGAGYHTVIRALDDCSLLLIPSERARALIRENAAVNENYIRFLSERIRFLNRKITAFTAGSAQARLAVYLAGLPVAEDGKILLHGSLSSLADALNMGRASLYRAFDALEAQNILIRRGKDILLLDPAALQNY